MAHLLFLWREHGELDQTPEQIQRRLEGSDDVEGLADLPIREMLDRVKSEFPGAVETAGLLAWKSGEESFSLTWGYQFLRIESHHLRDENRDQFLDLARSVGCSVYDPQLNLRMK